MLHVRGQNLGVINRIIFFKKAGHELASLKITQRRTSTGVCVCVCERERERERESMRVCVQLTGTFHELLGEVEFG